MGEADVGEADVADVANVTDVARPIALLRARWQALQRELKAAQTLEPRAVHQARVASRRLREALAVVSARGTKPASRRVRALTRALGPVRELDVTGDLAASLGRALGPSDAATLVAFRLHLTALREKRGARARAKLPGARGLARRLEGVLARLEERGDPGALKRIEGRVRARARRLEDAVARAGDGFAPEPIHRVRVAAKKLRYAIELATGPRRDVLLTTLRAAQAKLGAVQDLVVLDALVTQARSGSDARARAGLRRLGALALRECRALHGPYLTQRAHLLACCADARAAWPPRD